VVSVSEICVLCGKRRGLPRNARITRSGETGHFKATMPWQTITPMEEMIRFVMLVQSDRFRLTDLCGYDPPASRRPSQDASWQQRN
jgi:hypothetical protein